MRYRKNISRLLLLLCLCIHFTACGGDSLPTMPSGNNSPGSTGDKPSAASAGKSDEPAASREKGAWDNTPKVLIPEASGTDIKDCDVATVDYSHASDGYVMITYTGSNAKVKLQLTGPDANTYTYNLHGPYEVFPLTSGSGSYSIGIFENVEGTKYAPALTCEINADITNEFGPYLYPNQYVNFKDTSLPISQGEDLAYSCNTDLEVVEAVYNYIIGNFSYDYPKSETVQSGYLPDVDEIFTTQIGICFDYAAVTATMLRSQGIPTRLEVGYIGDVYHAWISTYIQNVGWVNGIIEFDGINWKLMDPTFASTSNSPKKFIAEDQDYLTKYVY